MVAYRQPVTRAEIEHVRGVDAGAVLRSLLERHLLRIAGHREVPGRPLLYATSRRFLEIFGLARIEDLPTLRDLAELAPPPVTGSAATPTNVESDAGEAAPERFEAAEDDEDAADDADVDEAFDDDDEAASDDDPLDADEDLEDGDDLDEDDDLGGSH